MAHVQRILVPCDGSPPSIAALAEAITLALDLDAAIDVLEVKMPKNELTPPPSASAGEAQALEEAFKSAKRALSDRLTRRIESGEPARTILNAAAQGYDLVVMGTHGRVGRLHATLGSVAETVVRGASCPVLTVRASTGEEETFAERIHRAKSIGEQARR